MTIYFFLFMPFIIINSIMVISSRNSVTAVLYLVSVFILASLNLLLIGADFLALLIVIIYIGAISILFLFVIMLLNLRIVEVYSSLVNVYPLGAFLGFFIFLELLVAVNKDFYFFSYQPNNLLELNVITPSLVYSNNNMQLVGDLLFNYYSVFLLFAGLILLLAMVGCILITDDGSRQRNKPVQIRAQVTFWAPKKKKYV